MRRAVRLRRGRHSQPRSGPIAAGGARDAAAFANRFAFTPRERRAFELLLDGLAPKQIAVQFGTSERMAERHVKNACRKCHVGDRCERVAFFARYVAGEEPPSDAA